MSDKCYRVEFTAKLHKLTLALKMKCEIEVVWKRGQKVAQSGKVQLIGGEAAFNKNLIISCNMIFNTASKSFKEKITKFSIILSSDKGVKQAGEIQFDVGAYINQKQLSNKQYQERLNGCPDKNAKLLFSLCGELKEQLSIDVISQKSYLNTDESSREPQVTVRPPNPSTNSTQTTPKMIKNPQEPKNINQSSSLQISSKIKILEEQNRKIKQELKQTDKLKQENEELRKKIKNEDYKKSGEIKQKIEKSKKEIEKMKSQIRAHKKIEQETAQVEEEILKCKIKIMQAFNYASQYRGGEFVDDIQKCCGILEA